MPRSLPPKSRVSHYITRAMEERPELAVKVARIATDWSRVEERMGFILTQLLGAEAEMGMVMYQALSGSASRASVLKAVARAKLNCADYDRLEVLLLDVKKVATKRNKVVHGHWYYSDDHPNGLVWVDSSEDLHSYSQFWAGYHGSATDDDRKKFVSEFSATRHNRLLYEDQDFDNILEEIRRLMNKILSFNLDCEKLNDSARKE